ncbi:MAG: dihydrodipicolinate reductase C-terminal domain-containing protein [Gemmatimonadaceae bacterium]|nr:dihydrodipicolinate reductase C-terminal domain-containing protein [Gemmatimonadaceae bacterium]
MKEPAIAIIGDGKMGRIIGQMVQERGWHLTAMLGEEHNRDGVGITRRALGDPDVAIEFTEPSSAVSNIMACIHEGVPVVIGTTGWYQALPLITATANEEGASLLWAPNFSVGVTLFVELAREAARIMSRSDFSAAMVETHHSAKKDAPSGTALAIARAMEGVMGKPLPVTSIRTGSVPGTHELIFDGKFEQIIMRHEARDRRVFADGALRAAQWLIGKKGVFTMRDVLGFSPEGTPEAK